MIAAANKIINEALSELNRNSIELWNEFLMMEWVEKQFFEKKKIPKEILKEELENSARTLKSFFV